MRPVITNAYFDSRSVLIVTVDSVTTGYEIADALRGPRFAASSLSNRSTRKVTPEIDARLRVVMEKGLVPSDCRQASRPLDWRNGCRDLCNPWPGACHP